MKQNADHLLRHTSKKSENEILFLIKYMIELLVIIADRKAKADKAIFNFRFIEFFPL